jgi:hypothetical protein
MPLDFKEVAPDPKVKENSQKARLAALVERKGKGPAPLHLDSQVIPSLVRKVRGWVFRVCVEPWYKNAVMAQM